MKLYGWDDTGVARGELLAADVPKRDLDFGLDAIAYDLQWDAIFTRFAVAKAALLAAMEEAGTDPELILVARRFKASYL